MIGVAREETRELVINALQGDHQSIEALVDRLEGTPTATAEDEAAAAGQQRADFRHAASKFLEEYGDLQDDPAIWKAVQEMDKTLANKYPDASYERRLEVVGEIARKKFGSHESRVIAEMGAQRRNRPAPDVFEREVAEEPDEFERERDADIAETIAEMRKGRAGVPLSEIRARRPGTAQETEE